MYIDGPSYDEFLHSFECFPGAKYFAYVSAFYCHFLQIYYSLMDWNESSHKCTSANNQLPAKIFCQNK